MMYHQQNGLSRRCSARTLALIPFAIAVPGELVSQTLLDNVVDSYRGELDVEINAGFQDITTLEQTTPAPGANQNVNERPPGILEPIQYWRSLSDPSQIIPQPGVADEGVGFGAAYQDPDGTSLDLTELSGIVQSVMGASDQGQFTQETRSRSIPSTAEVEVIPPPAGAASFPTNRYDVRTWAGSYSNQVLSTVEDVADSVLPPENTDEIQSRISALLNRIIGQ